MKKYSKKLAIFFSLLPGAGHMYLGLIKQGMELMGLFFFSIFVVGSFSLDLFGIFIPIIWFYSIFDIIDINRRASQEEPLEDGDLPIFKSSNITKSVKANNIERYIAYILIIMGVVSLIDNVIIPIMAQYYDYVLIRTTKNVCVSAAFILIGMFILKGKKIKNVKKNKNTSDKVQNSERIDIHENVENNEKLGLNNEKEKNENIQENNKVNRNLDNSNVDVVNDKLEENNSILRDKDVQENNMDAYKNTEYSTELKEGEK